VHIFLKHKENSEIKEIDILRENLKNSVGSVLDKVSYLKSGILYLTINEIKYNIAPAGGNVVGIYNEDDKALSNEVGKTINSINIDDFYSIKIKFSSGNIFYIEDDTGGEGLEIW